ncbi:MAG: carbohydrate ABC transporter permease [Anaerolineales bacterium]|nr:carbohydrate ABC transporter permease [Anaerolineales bacterium]
MPAGARSYAGKPRRRIGYVVGRILLHLLTIALSLLYVMPLLWALSTSLKPTAQVYLIPPEWIPRPFVWENYPNALTYVPFGRYIINTLKVALPSMIGIVISSSLVAYGFSRWRWPYRDVFFFICLATMMIPYQVTMVPLFIMYTNWGWVNSYLPLIVPHCFGNAYYIFLLRQFFRTIPEELSDAARVDGCSELGIFFRIVLPLSVPALATVCIFHFMWSWNDYLGPLIYLKDETLYTVSIGLTRYQAGGYTQPRWPLLMAASMTTLIPILILFFLAQRTFIEGISLTGIKG